MWLKFSEELKKLVFSGGKYNGIPLDETPGQYLNWAVEADIKGENRFGSNTEPTPFKLNDDVRKAIYLELYERHKKDPSKSYSFDPYILKKYLQADSLELEDIQKNLTGSGDFFEIDGI